MLYWQHLITLFIIFFQASDPNKKYVEYNVINYSVKKKHWSQQFVLPKKVMYEIKNVAV